MLDQIIDPKTEIISFGCGGKSFQDVGGTKSNNQICTKLTN